MHDVEKTLILIKPDGVRKQLIGEVVSRFEKKGLTVLKLEMMSLSREKAQLHYAEHVGKPFYPPLIDFITSGPLVAMVLEGQRAISVARKMCGATDSALAEAGTIRGDYSIYNNQNVVHSSDSAESATREISIYFG